MSIDHLDFGDSVTGLLSDGTGTCAAATLFVRAGDGISAEVPYLLDDANAHFGPIVNWFERKDPPRNLLLRSEAGSVGLFGVGWGGETRNWGTAVGRGILRPTVVALHARNGDLSDDLTVDELTSHVDGLNRWSGLGSLSDSSTFENGHRETTISLHGFPKASWRQGTATLSLVPDWRDETHSFGHDRRRTLHDMVGLQSTFDDGPHPVADHLTEQQKIVRLLVLLFGTPVAFRHHELRDARFTVPTPAGTTTRRVELLTRWTISDFEQPELKSSAAAKAFAGFAQIGAEGLATWAANFERWSRFILPAATAVRDRAGVIEDSIVSTSIAMEAAGRLIGPRTDENATYSSSGKPTTATDIYRVLDRLGLDWAGVSPTTKALSSLLANTYNEIKHFDRGQLPSSEQAFLVSEINKHIVRAFAVTLLSDDDRHVQWLRDANQRWQIADYFRQLRVELMQDGTLRRAH